MDNPIFIVGLPRSGSTLWAKIIERNENILRFREMFFLRPWGKDFRYFYRKKVGDLSVENNISKMITLIFSDEKTFGIDGTFWEDMGKFNDDKLKEKIHKKILESDKSLENIFKIIIEETTKFKGYDRCFVKFPVYFNYISKLLEWYPQCKIIHITRDPRAIAISKTNDPGGTQKLIKKYSQINHISYFIKKIMIVFVIFQYNWESKVHIKCKKFKNYALFRYEDLLLNPEKTIRELCEFSEIEFNKKMLYPGGGEESSLTGKKRKGFDKKAASRWEKAISPFEKKIVTFFTKNSMKRFGYDPVCHPVFKDV